MTKGAEFSAPFVHRIEGIHPFENRDGSFLGELIRQIPLQGISPIGLFALIHFQRKNESLA
jgi:hypothetical protein